MNTQLGEYAYDDQGREYRRVIAEPYFLPKYRWNQFVSLCRRFSFSSIEELWANWKRYRYAKTVGVQQWKNFATKRMGNSFGVR